MSVINVIKFQVNIKNAKNVIQLCYQKQMGKNNFD